MIQESKTTQCIKLLATHFLSLEVNSKVDNSKFYNKYEFSRGTVYASLAFLKKNKAIILKNQTKKGSFITKIDYKKLFKFTYHKKILCISPFPFTKNLQILVSAIEYVFAMKKIPFEIIYKPGGIIRSKLVKEESIDLALVSKITANDITKKYHNTYVINEFLKNSWTTSYAIMFSNKKFNKIEDGMNIGLDENSGDISILTKKIVGNKKVNFINKKYNSLLDELRKEKIDALLYNADDVQSPVGFAKPIDSIIAEKQFLLDSTTATLISNMNNKVVKNIFKTIITHKTLQAAIERIKKNQTLINY